MELVSGDAAAQPGVSADGPAAAADAHPLATRT
jgi:hypothetical protein